MTCDAGFRNTLRESIPGFFRRVATAAPLRRFVASSLPPLPPQPFAPRTPSHTIPPTATPMSSHYYESRSGLIHYDRRGLGDPVLLLHGIYVGASHAEYRHNIPALQRRFTVYALDLLGFGDSDAPRITHSAELHQHLLRDFILEEIGQPVSIVASGVSCGIAVRLGVYDDELLRRLVLICPVQKEVFRESPGIGDRVSQFVLGTLAAGVGLFETASSEASLVTFLRDRYHDIRKATPQLVQHLRTEASRPGSMHAYISLVNGFFDIDTLRWLRHLRAATQVIWGAGLGEAPADRILQPATWSHGKRLDIIENTRHWPHDERSAEVNRLMIDFLSAES